MYIYKISLKMVQYFLLHFFVLHVNVKVNHLRTILMDSLADYYLGI